MRLETTHLVLMPLQFTDANDHHSTAKEMLKDLSQRFAWAQEPFSLKNSQTVIQDGMANMREHKGMDWSIRTKAGKFMGGASLCEIKDAVGKSVPMFKLDCWVRNPMDAASDSGAEAFVVAADYAFKTLKARRVEARINDGDTLNAGRLTKAGFKLEGTLANARALSDEQAGGVQVWARVG